MGSTISYRKRAHAMQARDGNIYYALYEETCSTKDFPRRPHWGCVHFGNAESCMRRIIQLGAICEGGMLKEESGHVTASQYIKHWRTALENPQALDYEYVICTYGFGYYNSDVEKEKAIAKCIEVARLEGFEFNAERHLLLHLFEHARIVQRFFDEADISPWRTFHTFNRDAGAVPELGYKVKPVNVSAPDIQVSYAIEKKQRTSECHHFVFYPDGSTRGTGWAAMTMEKLILDFAIKSELATPGSAESCIRNLRKKVEKEAIPIDEDQNFMISLKKANNSFTARQFEKVQSALGATGDVITITMAELRKIGRLYEFFCMTYSMVEVLPSPRIASPSAVVMRRVLH